MSDIDTQAKEYMRLSKRKRWQMIDEALNRQMLFGQISYQEWEKKKEKLRRREK